MQSLKFFLLLRSATFYCCVPWIKNLWAPCDSFLTQQVMWVLDQNRLQQISGTFFVSNIFRLNQSKHTWPPVGLKEHCYFTLGTARACFNMNLYYQMTSPGIILHSFLLFSVDYCGTKRAFKQNSVDRWINLKKRKQVKTKISRCLNVLKSWELLGGGCQNMQMRVTAHCFDKYN